MAGALGDVLKLNVGARYLPHTSTGGTGLLLRDHGVKMLRGRAIWCGHAANTMIMEAVAVPILQEIQEPSGDMEFFQLPFVRREANVGTHLCTKQASATRTRCLWIN